MKELFLWNLVQSEDNTADIFTKNTSPQIFNKLSQRLVENVKQGQFADMETQNGGSVERQTAMNNGQTDILCEGQTEEGNKLDESKSMTKSMT